MSGHGRKASRKKEKEAAAAEVKDNNKENRLNESMITNRDNRVIITIGHNNEHQVGL